MSNNDSNVIPKNELDFEKSIDEAFINGLREGRQIGIEEGIGAAINALQALIKSKQEPVKPMTEPIDPEIRIEELNLSTRSYMNLKRANIETIGELAKYSKEKLSMMRNVGDKSLKEIVGKMANCGYPLAKY